MRRPFATHRHGHPNPRRARRRRDDAAILRQCDAELAVIADRFRAA